MRWKLKVEELKGREMGILPGRSKMKCKVEKRKIKGRVVLW